MQKECLQPEKIVGKYYQALYNGDLKSLKDMMTEDSYYMALEPFGIKLSFKDPLFKLQWNKFEVDKDTLNEVEKKLSKELLSLALSPQIVIQQIQENGLKRKIVYFDENGKHKKLYFSKKNCQWVIDYFAGRPVTTSYWTSALHWFKSLFIKCC